jgi:drug/metabolite transporter (DMT)-like permease
MVTIFALTAALLYGSSDFLGGAAAQRAHVLSVARLSALAGLGVVVLAGVASGEPALAAGAGWGMAAGAIGGVGLIIFYAGLAAGPMSVVAPVSALVSTILPVAAALAGGERPGAPVYAGAGLCLLAIVLVSSGASAQPAAGAARRPPGRALAYGIASGVSFGLFFLFIRNGGQAGPLWPVVAARIAGAAVILIAAAIVRPGPVSRTAGRAVLLAAALSGVVDASANICYVIATRAGLFGLAVVLTSLYPGVTVLLARVVLGERLRWVQRAGLALAAVGVLLVTV